MAQLFFAILLLTCCSCSSIPQTSRDESFGGNNKNAIRLEVLRDLIGNRDGLASSKSNLRCLIFFIETDSDLEKAEVEKMYKNGCPAVICDQTRISYDSNGRVLDKITGGRAIVFNVKIDSILDNKAYVTGSAYSGNTGCDFYVYTLVFKDKHWLVVDKRYDRSS